MEDLIISKYCMEDNTDALELEGLCPQGKSIQLKFVRSLFHKRSEVYKDYKINCAKIKGKLIGIGAGAKKQVKGKDNIINALYGYDLRVHPEHRKFGVGKILTNSILDSFDNDFDCAYSLIASENERALGLIKRGFGAKFSIPLTYVILPVYKTYNIEENFINISGLEAHNNYLINNPNLEFVPFYEKEKMLGHINSISVGANTTVSIWNNEKFLAERVIQLSRRLKFLKMINLFLKPFIKLPRIPGPNEIIKSWFIYDLHAESKESLKATLMILNNLAIKHDRAFLYILLQNNCPYLKMIKDLKFKTFFLSYFFIAKGRKAPGLTDQIYIDVRDL